MLRFHSDEFKFFCDLCPRKSKQLKEIRRHVLSHIQKEFREKFPCENCSDKTSFSSKRRLEMHIFMNHADHPRIHICDCGKAFKTQAHLTHHIKEMHNLGSFPCEKCLSRIFPTKSKLDRHLRGKLTFRVFFTVVEKCRLLNIFRIPCRTASMRSLWKAAEWGSNYGQTHDWTFVTKL